jgi:hypothetical protein
MLTLIFFFLMIKIKYKVNKVLLGSSNLKPKAYNQALKKSYRTY